MGPSSSSDGGVNPSFTLEMQAVHYDGRVLSGRFLVGAGQQSVKLDRRVIENITLTVESVSDCANGQQVEYVFQDMLAPSAQEEDLLVLEPGFWYGAEVRFRLFGMLSVPPGPECIDVGFSFQPMSGAPRTRLNVRATRDARPSTADANDAGGF